jgi:hypothetical protein
MNIECINAKIEEGGAFKPRPHKICMRCMEYSAAAPPSSIFAFKPRPPASSFPEPV